MRVSGMDLDAPRINEGLNGCWHYLEFLYFIQTRIPSTDMPI